MSKEPNLFEANAFNALQATGLEVEVKERVVKDHYVTINGVRFDADDLSETLENVSEGFVTTSFTPERFEVLKELGVLESQGSQKWMSAAELGPNGREFINLLNKALWGEDDG